MGDMLIFNEMVIWGNDDFSNDPNPSKELTKEQRKLFVRWLTDEKFYWEVLSTSYRNVIVSVMVENEYNTHSKWKLGQIREKWITYLKKEPK